MARYNENDGSLRPEPPKPKVKRKPRKVAHETCRACGFKMKLSRKFKMTIEAHDGMCSGCAKHFGHGDVWGMTGSTDLSFEDTIEKMNEIEEAKHILIMKSANFGVPESGDMVGVDFGDIFAVSRVGTETKPTGKWDYARLAYSVSIKINGNDLVLFLHEVAPMNWIKLMELKKSGEYEEAYLSTEDQSGYWKPSDETKASIVNQFGNL